MSSSTISMNGSSSPISTDVNSDSTDLSTSSSPEKGQEEEFISDQKNDNAEQVDEVDDLQLLTYPTHNTKSRDIRRNSWARSSLRIPATPSPDHALVPPRRWGSFRPVRHSSTSTAAALFSSGKVISSSLHSVNGEEGELDIQSVSSIEEGVIDLDSKVEQLREQLEHLVDKQISTDKRYNRVKQDNTNLMARIHMLEEHIGELRVRGEERLEEEVKRNKEQVQRLKRENKLEIENYSIRIQGMEKHHSLLNIEVADLKIQLDQSRENKNRMESNLSETQIVLLKEQEEHKKLKEVKGNNIDMDTISQHQEMSPKEVKRCNQIADLSQNDSGMQLQDCDEMFEDNPAARIVELEMEINVLRNKNISVSESYEELQAQMLSKGLEEGRSLLAQNHSFTVLFQGYY